MDKQTRSEARRQGAQAYMPRNETPLAQYRRLLRESLQRDEREIARVLHQLDTPCTWINERGLQSDSDRLMAMVVAAQETELALQQEA